nr:hypothetical protein [Chitinophagales bacterium]
MNRRNLLIACGTALTLAAAVFFTMKPDHSESAAAADYFDPSYSAVSWAQQAQLERSGLAQSWMDAVKERSTVGIMLSVRKVQTSIPPAMQ